MESNGLIALIVDEDDSFLDIAVVVLESLGFAAVTAQDGDEALAILWSRPSIALLLTEIVLPGAVNRGSDLARFAKQANPCISIVYTTRYGPMLLLDSEAPRDGLLLRKGWDQGELKAALSNVLECTVAAG